jgi:peptide/nickel transport system ATP-binding protein
MSGGLLLEARRLEVDIRTAGGLARVVRGIDLELPRGGSLGLVGESGSGKSVAIASLFGLLPGNAERRAARLRFEDADLLAMSAAQVGRRLRGRRVGYVFQEPMTALNPVMPVGAQLEEVLTAHGLADAAAARRRALELCERVGIVDASQRLKQYPHQFSGGQRQRLTIAMALMARPALLVADEPTTALDVTVQAEILALLDELRRELGMGLILVSHNLGVVARVADRVAILYAGEVVEEGPAGALFSAPRHPYTRGLLRALPERAAVRGALLAAIAGRVPAPAALPAGCAFAPRCPVALATCRDAPPAVQQPEPDRRHRCVFIEPPQVHAPAAPARPVAIRPPRPEPVLEALGLTRIYRPRGAVWRRGREIRAVDDVSLALHDGELLAVIGESGCGKSTLARLLIGLDAPQSGSVTIAGTPVGQLAARARAQAVQPVFQDPRGSLNPRRTILEILVQPLRLHGLGEPAGRERRAREMLERVGLPQRLAAAFPAQMSGGQRQRVAIARALMLEPRALLLDEPTSALDVSVQAQILNLLQELRRETGMAYLLITHDLAVVRHVADRVAVMQAGRIVEEGAAEAVMQRPRHPYTRALLRAAPLCP